MGLGMLRSPPNMVSVSKELFVSVDHWVSEPAWALTLHALWVLFLVDLCVVTAGIGLGKLR